MTGTLQDWDGEEVEIGSPTNEALKFLVHFYGDLHMPLHLAGRARGGNGIKVLFDGRHTSVLFASMYLNANSLGDRSSQSVGRTANRPTYPHITAKLYLAVAVPSNRI
jgi:hypothetical protein